MGAVPQPLEANRSDQETWQTLVGDQRYRLFAAGNRRAAIAECLPGHLRPANLGNQPAGSQSFDARYGLKTEVQKRMVLLTEVFPVPDRGPHNAQAGARRKIGQWRWEATHSVQPISQLKSYIDEQSGSCVFFLTRSMQPAGGPPTKTRERLVDSAVRIGKSLGLDSKNLEALRVAGLVHELGKISPAQAAGRKYYVTGDDDRDGSDCCRIDECAKPACVRLEAVPFCTEHFISTCYQRLDWSADRLSQRPASEQESEALWSFLRACIEQTRALTRDPFHQESLERARLLDILHTAMELSRHMRRSPRLREAIPVRLHCETPGRPWEERLNTKLISRHGAMLECAHLVKPEDWLFVERVDNGTKARARMAWRGPAAAGHFEVALEFLDADNFWGMSWTENAPGGPGAPAKVATA